LPQKLQYISPINFGGFFKIVGNRQDELPQQEDEERIPEKDGIHSGKYVLYQPSDLKKLNTGTIVTAHGTIIVDSKIRKSRFLPGALYLATNP